MIASNISEGTLRTAAMEVGVAIELTATSGSGRRFRVKLFPHTTKDHYTPSGRRRKGEKGDAKYQREAAGYFTPGRRIHAVCWHGFRDYFRAAFKREPEATFYTAMDTWRGSEDFEERYRESGHRNIGSQARPTMAAEACRCSERGMAV